MPGKTPHSNGNEPVDHDVRNSADVKDGKGKNKKAAKEGDDEMTVVVPPSKANKQSAPPPADADVDGDVSMGDEEATDAEVKIDPVAQTVAGSYLLYLG